MINVSTIQPLLDRLLATMASGKPAVPAQSVEAGKPAWTQAYGFSHPERYIQNLAKYRLRGGIVDPAIEAARFADGLESHRNDMARFYSFCLIADLIVKDGLKGDIAELGVWQGNTASLLADFGRKLGRMIMNKPTSSNGINAAYQ